MKIDTKRMHNTACALRTVILWLEKSRHHHPESGTGQICERWKKDADWLKRQAKRLSCENAKSEGSPPSRHETKQERNGDSLH